MTVGKKVIFFFTIITLIGGIAVVGTLVDAEACIREVYPSASVTVHEGHSPGVRPLLSVMRILRGQRFIPAAEWIGVQLTSEDKPVDLATLFKFKVISLQLTHCKVNDLAPLLRRKPSTYAVFISCDLSAVPATQKAALLASGDNSERFIYGGP